MNEQDDRQAPVLQSPAINDLKAWQAYWEAQKQPWRREPEIDRMRQEELKGCLTEGTYPFAGMKLSRADVEWLLATLENGPELVDWSIENRWRSEGPNVVGADLHQVDLHGLPLARMRLGLTFGEWELDEQWDIVSVNLEGADLSGADLNGNLILADLSNANLSGADLRHACLIGANLHGANLSGANLYDADLAGANLRGANLSGADLCDANFSGGDLSGADLRGTDLQGAGLDGADLSEANLSNTDLKAADLCEANLAGANLKDAKNITAEELEKQAKSLKGATMPDGSTHP